MQSPTPVAPIIEQSAPAVPLKTWLVAGLLVLCYTLSYMDRVVLSVLVEPIKASLNISDTQIGLLQGVSFSLFYVLASLPLAFYADNSHRPRMLAICVSFWSFMTMLSGMAFNFIALLCARIGMAIGEAGLPPAALTMMGDMFDPRRLARATSLFMLAPFLGGGLALLVAGVIYDMTAGWVMPVIPGLGVMERWHVVFIGVGLPGVLVALIFLLINDPRPVKPKAERDSIIPVELFRLLRKQWQFHGVYMLSVALMMTLMSAYIAWLPAAIMRSKGIDEKTVGVLFGPVYLLCGAAGTLCAGFIIGRVSSDIVGSTLRYMRMTACMMLPVAVAGPLVSSLWMELAMMGAAIFMVSSIAGLSSLPFQYVVPKHLRARTMALLALVSALLGTGMGPMIVGVLSDQLTFLAHPLSSALAIVGVLVIPVVIFMLSSVLRFFNREMREGVEAQFTETGAALRH